MIRLATVEGRLKQAAGGLCPVQRSTVAALVDDRSAYPRTGWADLDAAVGLHALPQVIFVEPDGPAQRGGLRPGDELVSIGGQNVAGKGAEASSTTQVLDRLNHVIEQLPPDRANRFDVVRGGSQLALQIAPIVRCSAQFALSTDNALDAHSDGVNVAITARLIDFTENDDELAFILAHELSHVIFQDGAGGDKSGRRTKETRADEFGAALARCAGYDMASATDVLPRLSKRDRLSWLGDPAHGSNRSRTDRIRAAAARPCSELRK